MMGVYVSYILLTLLALLPWVPFLYIEFFRQSEKEWTYTRVQLPLKNPHSEEKVNYPAKVRYTEDGDYQIFVGVPKRDIGWHTVESDNIKNRIEEQI